ncbi:MAG: triose-phosphate isomerase [Candidatus Woesearchaeota archaeon]|jgi:triosephosphate isomerase|nr:triose-phosphate isomerase [Candidatus Woesearchaeota archaeon]
MRTPIIAGNWKMNKTIGESVSTIKELRELAKGISDKEIVICPPFTALSNLSAELNVSNISLGAQNMYQEEKGAFTGEISPLMIKEVGCKYVIIGHSERRQHFKETNEIVNQKIKLALKHDLKPILCIGETLDQREKNVTKNVIGDQLRNGLKDVEDLKNIVIAYEPIWAIGTGQTATPKQAENVHAFIRETISKIFDDSTSKEIRILYGGSVKPENITELMQRDNIDGALVGGASLDALQFSRIIRY